MNGLTNIFSALGNDPMTKWVAAAFLLRALWSVVAWRRCAACQEGPGRDDTRESVQRRRDALWLHDGRFLAMMLGGIALSIFGLFRLAGEGGPGALAVLMLVVGMYMFLSEPVRRQIADVRDRQALAILDGDDRGVAMAQAMLRGNHLNLVMIELGFVAAFGLGAGVLGDGLAGMEMMGLGG